MTREIQVIVIRPDGVREHVTDWIDMSAIGELTESLEDELLVLTHGDFELSIRDPNGYWAGLLRDSKLSDVWHVVIERETLERRPKWERIFGGILQTPETFELDRQSSIVSVQAFSYSKVLERGSAEDTRRDIGIQSASGTSGTAVLTLDPGTATTDEFVVGDLVTLRDGSNSETHRIVSIASATSITVSVNLTNTYTAATLTLDTPYPRDIDLTSLAEQLFDIAGIKETNVQVEHIEAPEGVSSPPYRSGWFSDIVDPDHDSFLRRESDPETVEVMVHSDATYRATGPTSGFAAGGPDLAKGDWTPYADTEPASLVNVDTVFGDTQSLNTRLIQNDPAGVVQQRCFDHANGDYYELWDPWSTPKPEIMKNGVAVQTLDHYDTLYFINNDFDPTTGLVVLSFAVFDPVHLPTGTYNHAVAWYDPVADTYGDTLDSGAGMTTNKRDGGGGVRTIARHGVVAIQRLNVDDTFKLFYPGSAPIDFWRDDGAGGYAISRTTPEVHPPLDMWTMRAFDDFIAVLYGDTWVAGFPDGPGGWSGAMRCRVINWSTLETAADFQVVPDVPFGTKSYLTTFVTTNGQEVVVGNVGGQMFTIARSFVGTVPYADFDGLSCGGALRDMALATVSYLYVDNFQIGFLQSRSNRAGSSVRITDASIEKHIERSMHEQYVASVAITGTEDDGTEFEVLEGDTGDSAHRAELSSSIVTSAGQASSVASAYAALLSGDRRQHDIDTRGGARLHANELWWFEGRLYRVISSALDIAKDSQSVKMIETTPEPIPALTLQPGSDS